MVEKLRTLTESRTIIPSIDSKATLLHIGSDRYRYMMVAEDVGRLLRWFALLSGEGDG